MSHSASTSKSPCEVRPSSSSSATTNTRGGLLGLGSSLLACWLIYLLTWITKGYRGRKINEQRHKKRYKALKVYRRRRECFWLLLLLATMKNTSGFKKNFKPGNPKNKKGKRTANRQNKLHIKFDLNDRREYLTGFQKRKKERREKAYKKLQEDLKAEKKQMKKDRKDIVKKMIQQGQELMAHGGIGVIDDDDKEEEEEDEKEKNKVKVNYGSAMVEICDLDLTSKHHIGINQMDVDSEENKKSKKHPTGKTNPSKNDDDEDDSKPQKEEEEEEEEDVSPENLERLGIHSQRDLVRSLKKSSAKALKHSHLMKQKQMRDATKQKKTQARENNRRRKLKARKMRHKGGRKGGRDTS